MSPVNRDALVKRYLELQDEARKLLPNTRTPHITMDMSDDEIIRLGKWLASIVEAAKEKRNDRL
jgi:hypothetical protein